PERGGSRLVAWRPESDRYPDPPGREEVPGTQQRAVPKGRNLRRKVPMREYLPWRSGKNLCGCRGSGNYPREGVRPLDGVRWDRSKDARTCFGSSLRESRFRSRSEEHTSE